MNTVIDGSQKERKIFNGEGEVEDIRVSALIGRTINRYFECQNNEGKEKIS